MNKTKLFFWVLSVFMGISLLSSSCKDEDELELSGASSELSGTSSFNIDAEGSSVSFNISSNVSWTITGYKSWVKVSPQSGSGSKAVTVTVDANTTTADRSCTLEVKSNNGKLGFTVQINQKGLIPTLSVSPGYIEFEASASKEKTFQVQCNTEWTLSGVPDWLRADHLNGTKNGTVRLTTLSQNSDLANREATITVTAGDPDATTATATISVSQVTSIANCSAKIKSDSEIILKNGYYADVDFSANVKGFYAGYIKASDAKPYTQQELYYVVQQLENYSPDEYDYVMASELSPNTEYIYCILPYVEDAKGYRTTGPLTQKRITTKTTSDVADAPIGNVAETSTKWQWEVFMNSHCAKYFMMAYDGTKAQLFYYYYSDIEIAKLTLLAVDTKNDYYINQRSYSMSKANDSALLIWTWGVSDSGEFSGNIRYGGFMPTRATSSSDMPRSTEKKVIVGDMVRGDMKHTRSELKKMTKYIKVVR